MEYIKVVTSTKCLANEILEIRLPRYYFEIYNRGFDTGINKRLKKANFEKSFGDQIPFKVR